MNTRSRVNALAISAMSVAALALMAPPATAAVELLSHRAVYRLSLLDGTGSAGGVTNVTGGLVMEWRDSCVGAISNQRLGFVARFDDGPGFAYDVRFSSWESPDNQQLRFSVRSFDDGLLFEEFRGEATLAEDGAGAAEFEAPPGETLTLPAGTLFPTEHLRRLIEGAELGEMVVSHDVFDGSGPEGLSRITAVIGRSKAAAKDEDVSGARRWPVSLAYHEATGSNELPDFEISFDLSERGVLHDLILNYDDFALKADLEQLETFEAPRCP